MFGLGVAAAAGAVLIMVLYLIHEAFGAGFYKSPLLLWAMPAIMFLWLGRIWLLAGRNELDDDPLWFAVRDNVSLVLGACHGGGVHQRLADRLADLMRMTADGTDSSDRYGSWRKGRVGSWLAVAVARHRRAGRSCGRSPSRKTCSAISTRPISRPAKALDEGAVATWETSESAAVGFVNIPILAWLFVPLALLGELGGGLGCSSRLGVVAIVTTYVAACCGLADFNVGNRRDARAVVPRQRSAGQQPARRQHDAFHPAAAGGRAAALARRRRIRRRAWCSACVRCSSCR